LLGVPRIGPSGTGRYRLHVIDKLHRSAQALQAEARIPALAIAVRRNDRPTATYEVGTSGTDRPLDAATRMRIGSVTKTFTSVLIMQARDAGLISLADPVGRYLTIPDHGELTIRQMLSHTSGLQREPHGDLWYRKEMPSREEFLADLRSAEALYPPSRRFHYSNLAYALLGQVAEKVLGRGWADLVQHRITGPLGLTATSPDVDEHSAIGYMVDPYSDEAKPESPTSFGAFGPAMQLWSTATDMATWGAFLADPLSIDPDGKVLAASTLEEMRWPLTTRDGEVWSSAFGLGLIVYPRPGRALNIGHNGAMPGFLAASYGRAGGEGNPGGFGIAVLASSGVADAIFPYAQDLAERVLADDPADIAPWQPGSAAPDDLRAILGRWWSEGYELVFRYEKGALVARGADDPAGTPPAVFAPTQTTDVLRTVSGREVGELLRVHRAPDGTVTSMHWATYRVTRTQETFG